MSSIQHRIVVIRTALGLNQSAFAESIEVKRPTLIGYENGKAPPSSDFLAKVNERWGVSIDWLVTGKGQMNLKTDTVSDLPSKLDTVADLSDEQGEIRTFTDLVINQRRVPASDGIAPLPEDLGFGNLADPREITVYRFKRGSVEPQEVHAPDPEGSVFLPLYCQMASAGPGQMPTQLPETETTIPILYQLLGSHRPQTCGVVKVVGDSMSDIGLFNGDYVIFDRADLRGDGIFVITQFSETRVKRLQYRISDRKIVISSENAKRYPDPETVPLDSIDSGDLLIHGRVFSWLHRHPY